MPTATQLSSRSMNGNGVVVARSLWELQGLALPHSSKDSIRLEFSSIDVRNVVLIEGPGHLSVYHSHNLMSCTVQLNIDTSPLALIDTTPIGTAVGDPSVS